MMFRWINKQQGMESFEIDAVITKKSMIEYHRLITVRPTFYSNTAVYGGEMSMVNLVTCLVSLFWST